MLGMKETVRLYKTEINAHHAVGALRRYGWEVAGKPARLELAKGKVVWEVRGVRGLSILIRIYDAYVAARKVVEKALGVVEAPKGSPKGKVA